MVSDDKLSPLPKRLKAARLAVELSQKRLGIAAGIDEFSAGPRINQYEKTTHTPTYALTVTFAKILKVPVHYFYIQDDDIAELVLLLDQLPADKKQKVIGLVEILL
ncbi:MAG: helix-turn-helix transcriptional regulator [Mariprofundaceae bacterium]|nr:helix-turn-helix transcriptional regulator [Mariprofundaceae bacterium]